MPTRQTPYTVSGTDYYVYLEKSVNGTITAINSWTVANSTSLRVVAVGNSITVYRNGTTQVGAATDATHSTATLHGCGLGGTDSSSPPNRLTYVTMKQA